MRAYRTHPKAILKAARTKAFRDGFTDFIRRMEKEGKAGSYLSRFKRVLNSWLSYNGINVKLKVNIRGESDTPRIADERVPNKEELDRILRWLRPRADFNSAYGFQRASLKALETMMVAMALGLETSLKRKSVKMVWNSPKCYNACGAQKLKPRLDTNTSPSSFSKP
jgi:hypothetical protein